MCSLLSGESDFVAVDTEKTNAFFAFVFTTKVFHLLVLCRALGNPVQESHEATEQISQMHLPCVGRPRKQVLFSLETGWLQGRPNSSLPGPSEGLSRRQSHPLPSGALWENEREWV